MRNPSMVGDRVYLRPLEVEDAGAIAAMDAGETDTFMWRDRTPTSPLEHAQNIAEVYRRQPPGRIALAVCLREGDRIIGTVSLFDIDWVNRTGETGSFLAADARGRALGTEAKHLLLEYCFDRIHLHVLRSEVDEPNTRSAAALAKQGYRPAGRRKWHDVKDGRYVDMLLFDVTRPDWLAARDAWRATAAAGSAAT
jgi:RimJ/RimL family protein N-acetyltransferase